MAIVTESPRFEDKTFKWYVGDTFTLTFNITFTGSQGLNFSSLDALVFEFYGKSKKEPIATYTFSAVDNNSDSSEDSVQKPNHKKVAGPSAVVTGKTYYEFNLVFDDEYTTFFPVGGYTFCAIYTKETARTTIIGRGAIEVESCH